MLIYQTLENQLQFITQLTKMKRIYLKTTLMKIHKDLYKLQNFNLNQTSKRLKDQEKFQKR